MTLQESECQYLHNSKTQKCDLKAKAKEYRAAANLINADSSKH